ncbi:hypothetical protein TWF694_000232 [Orbilia ellipsospora]|uniref:Uncharacterized protein n=1 Tax=Orbilia ellipsospora TaxID=2528407 RepID=A0AAV9XPR1_9PEZI
MSNPREQSPQSFLGARNGTPSPSASSNSDYICYSSQQSAPSTPVRRVDPAAFRIQTPLEHYYSRMSQADDTFQGQSSLLVRALDLDALNIQLIDQDGSVITPPAVIDADLDLQIEECGPDPQLGNYAYFAQIGGNRATYKASNIISGQNKVLQNIEFFEANPQLKPLENVVATNSDKPHRHPGEVEYAGSTTMVTRASKGSNNRDETFGDECHVLSKAYAEIGALSEDRFTDAEAPLQDDADETLYNSFLVNDESSNSDDLDQITFEKVFAKQFSTASATPREENANILQRALAPLILPIFFSSLQGNPENIVKLPTISRDKIEIACEVEGLPDLTPIIDFLIHGENWPASRTWGIEELSRWERRCTQARSETRVTTFDTAELANRSGGKMIETLDLAVHVSSDSASDLAAPNIEDTTISQSGSHDAATTLEAREALTLCSASLLQITVLRQWCLDLAVTERIRQLGGRIVWLPRELRWSHLDEVDPLYKLLGDELAYEVVEADLQQLSGASSTHLNPTIDSGKNPVAVNPQDNIPILVPTSSSEVSDMVVGVSQTHGPGITILPNGTKVYTVGAGTVLPGPDSVSRPGVVRVALGASPVLRGRKRKRVKKTEDDNKKAASVAEKQPWVDGQPTGESTPHAEFSLVSKPPQGYPWETFAEEEYGRASFLQKHLPVFNTAYAEVVLRSWESEWTDVIHHAKFLVGLPMEIDPEGSAQRLTRFAQPMCKRIGERLGGEYYDRLVDIPKKEIYGHIYFKMCLDLRRRLAEEYRVEEDARLRAKAYAVHCTNVQSTKRKMPKAEEGAEKVEGSAKRQKPKTSPRRYGNDGKIVRQRDGRYFGRAENRRTMAAFYNDEGKLRIQRELAFLERK